MNTDYSHAPGVTFSARAFLWFCPSPSRQTRLTESKGRRLVDYPRSEAVKRDDKAHSLF
jgi:hypothetical protein